MHYPARSLLRFAFALGLSAPDAAHASAPQSLSVATAGACPSAQDVTEELRLLLPDALLGTSDDVTRADVVVADKGSGFTVRVHGQRRRFRDAKRDCTERARHVAVFTVLIVDPLRVPSSAVDDAEEEPEPAEIPPEPSGKPGPRLTEPASTSKRATSLDLSLGPLAQIAIRGEAGGAAQAGGLGLRLRYGRSVGVTLGLAGLLPTSLQFARAQARATWMPMDLGLSLSQRASSWEVAFDAGLAFALLLVEGEALDATEQAVRLEAGGRAGVQVRFWASGRAGIYGGLSGSWFPKPYSLEVEGLGVVGRTPSGWMGGSLGAIIRL